VPPPATPASVPAPPARRSAATTRANRRRRSRRLASRKSASGSPARRAGAFGGRGSRSVTSPPPPRHRRPSATAWSRVSTVAAAGFEELGERGALAVSSRSSEAVARQAGPKPPPRLSEPMTTRLIASISTIDAPWAADVSLAVGVPDALTPGSERRPPARATLSRRRALGTRGASRSADDASVGPRPEHRSCSRRCSGGSRAFTEGSTTPCGEPVSESERLAKSRRRSTFTCGSGTGEHNLSLPKHRRTRLWRGT